MAGTINSFPINTKGWPDFALNTTPSDSDLIMTRSGSSTAPMTSEVSRQFHGGIIPWTGSFSFKTGGYTDRNGSLYRAKQDHSNQDPELDVTETYWEPKDGLTDSDRVELKSGRKNVIINGNFGIWHRATSQTSSGYGSDDRWKNLHTGSTKTHSRQAFTLGQSDVPNNPSYFSRTAVTSVAGSANSVNKTQAIESVTTFTGETITLSFWAKADSSKSIATEFVQQFGTGGSPSSAVQEIGVTTHNLTTTWQKYTTTISIPSVSGKTLGTDNNDFLELYFWFDAGVDFNSRTNSLGQQSGTFDIAQVQIEKGSYATDFERRSIGEEIQLAARYLPYFKGDNNVVGVAYDGATANNFNTLVSFPVEARVPPTGITISAAGDFNILHHSAGGAVSSLVFSSGGVNGAVIVAGASPGTDGDCALLRITATTGYIFFEGCEL